MSNNRKETSLIGLLISLTFLSVLSQALFFFIHYKVAEIVDALANTSVVSAFFHPVIWLPILGFIFIQIIAYGLFIGWVWFLTVSLGELFHLSKKQIYWCGILLWILATSLLFVLNAYYFPSSFFAEPLYQYFSSRLGLVMGVLTLFLIAVIVMAYVNAFWFKRHQAMAWFFILIAIFVQAGKFWAQPSGEKIPSLATQPNIILIGLDSLRPDYVNNTHIHTPNIDQFLKTSTVFTNAYTPLGRTFPSWVSVLTGKYPLHHRGRMNLANPANIISNETLAKKLRTHGYFTIYGTDETRFTDITQAYGFDRIIGPSGGAVEFLLGGLSDFPLSNLLINLPIGKILFPYNYGNRAAEITYEPDKFLSLVAEGLANRPDKPVFLAIHLCLSHWPFRWAHDGQAADLSVPERYRSSVEAIDTQFGQLLAILKQAGLLDHSMVVLLSDHGVTLGMVGDRFINAKNYRGDPKKMKSVSAYKLGSAPDFTLDIKKDFTVNTSYGQGTDVLSLKQNHIVLAFKGYGIDLLPNQRVAKFNSVLNIAPTILEYLHYAPLRNADGVSVWSLIKNKKNTLRERPFFIETGDKVTEIESNKIFVEQVVKKTLGAYQVDAKTGLLVLAPEAEQSIIGNKQHAILWGDWLLALYPAEMRYKLTTVLGSGMKKQLVLKPAKSDPYYVLVNLKTGQWTVGLDSPFAKMAPTQKLLRELKAFYGSEV